MQAQLTSKTLSQKVTKETPANIENFIKCPKSAQILRNRGINQLMPIQFSTYEKIYHGQDVIAKDRTGSGKTLAYALPIVMRMRTINRFRGHFLRFLIVVPTRQLSMQVRDEINSLAFRDQDDFMAVAVYGGKNMQNQIKELSKGADIVAGTPGRIIDFIRKGVVQLENLQVICLDQADEMLNIGFKQDIEQIFRLIAKRTKFKMQCLMFSATIPDWIWKMSDIYQSKTRAYIDMLVDGRTNTSVSITHYCLNTYYIPKQFYFKPIIDYFIFSKLEKQEKRGKILIFCQTKRDVDRLTFSQCLPIPTGMLHGDMCQQEREKTFRDYKFGAMQCLLATNIAARGLDFPDIDLVIQIQPPRFAEHYIHRAGRTGRIGKSGLCVTLYNYEEEQTMIKIEKQAKIRFIHIDPNQLGPIYKGNPHRQKVWEQQQDLQSQFKQKQKQKQKYPLKNLKQLPHNFVNDYHHNQSPNRYQEQYQDTYDCPTGKNYEYGSNQYGNGYQYQYQNQHDKGRNFYNGREERYEGYGGYGYGGYKRGNDHNGNPNGGRRGYKY